MSVRIEKPGIYLNVPASQYHADPCIAPSLSSGIAKKSALQTPRHVFHGHPRLNPDYDPSCDDEIKRNTAEGSSCHELFLGIGGGIEVVDLVQEKKDKKSGDVTRIQIEDWRTDVAKKARDEAIANGMTPRLKCEYERDLAIVDEAKNQLRWLDLSGDREAVLITEDRGFWSRSMNDILRVDELTIIDLKFTKIIADEDAFGRHAYNMGYDIQDAHYRRNLSRLRGVDPNAIQFWFVCVECPPKGPILTAAHKLDRALQVIGQERHRNGEAKWQECLLARSWPGYPEKIMEAKAPQWALNEHIRKQEMMDA